MVSPILGTAIFPVFSPQPNEVLALPLFAVSWALFNVWRVAFRQVEKGGRFFWKVFISLHHQNLTWNLKITVSKWTFLFQGPVFRFHVKFRGCIGKDAFA